MPSFNVQQLVEVKPNAPLDERLDAVRKSYDQDSSQMTSVLARQYNLTELEVIGVLPRAQVTRLDATQWETIIRSFSEAGDVHVLVASSSATLEVYGEFGNFSMTGPFFNVMTKTIDMHIRYDNLMHIFAIEKPSHTDGASTLSIQFYNNDGQSAFKVFFTFGGKAPSPERRAQWEAIRDRCRLT